MTNNQTISFVIEHKAIGRDGETTSRYHKSDNAKMSKGSEMADYKATARATYDKTGEFAGTLTLKVRDGENEHTFIAPVGFNLTDGLGFIVAGEELKRTCTMGQYRVSLRHDATLHTFSANVCIPGTRSPIAIQARRSRSYWRASLRGLDRIEQAQDEAKGYREQYLKRAELMGI